MPVADLITAFKADLADNRISDLDLERKHITHGTPYCFAERQGLHFDLKNEIANKFTIHPEFVKIVGSAKLGFSVVKQKMWKPFDEDSDIDVAIVGDDVFDRYWCDLLTINIDLTPRTNREDQLYRSFLNYFFKGWLRPDLLPFQYGEKTQWFKYFEGLSYRRFGPQKISAAVFRTFYFFERYHTLHFGRLRAGRGTDAA